MGIISALIIIIYLAIGLYFAFLDKRFFSLMEEMCDAFFPIPQRRQINIIREIALILLWPMMFRDSFCLWILNNKY